MKSWTVLILAGLVSCSPKTDFEKAFTKAEAHIARGEYKKSIDIYEKIVDTDPRCPQAWLGLGEIFFFQSNLIELRVQVLNFVARLKGNPGWKYTNPVDWGVVDRITLEKGIQAYQEIFKSEPQFKFKEKDTRYIHYQLGWAALAKEEFGAARKELAAAKLPADCWNAEAPLYFLNWLAEQK